jgi:hypothetical protein
MDFYKSTISAATLSHKSYYVRFAILLTCGKHLYDLIIHQEEALCP